MEGADWTAVIIEDDPDVRELIDLVLSQSGFRTVLAEDGLEGVEAVRRHNPLITTLDVNMPGMDGFAVAKRLREFSNTYLIFITALGDEIDRTVDQVENERLSGAGARGDAGGSRAGGDDTDPKTRIGQHLDL